MGARFRQSVACRMLRVPLSGLRPTHRPMAESGRPPASSASTPQSVPTGDFPQIPGYRLLRRLGQGGMASVYLAMQESLDRPVSVKVMEREALLDEVSKQRFEHEARTIAKLSHPCIVNIYEVGRTVDGQMYYIMPYLPNGDLAQRNLSNNESRIVELLRSLLSALGYAHGRGIVHRDVKRENVLFDAADRPLLTDFGIALSRRDTSRITTAGLAVGSSGYMAPEQARGDEVDGRADLYSVGVLAFELLTGDLPFRSLDPLALALMHAQKPVPRLPPAKSHWQAFVDRAMAKSPAQRFRNAQQMQHALDRLGRRTGTHLSSRVLRKFDHAIEGKIWKRPHVLVLTVGLLLLIGLYAARSQLPHFGRSVAAAAQPVATAVPVTRPSSIASASAAAIPAHPLPARPLSVAPASATVMPSVPIAAQVSIPAPASTAIKPSTAVVAQPAAPNPAITPDAAVLGAARDALQHANLTAPADNNALDLTKMAWKLSPAKPDTKQLVADVLKAISVQQALAINQHHDQRVLDYQQNAQVLADATIGQSTAAWRALRSSLAGAVGHRVQLESATSDTAALARTQTLARQLDLSDAYARAVATAKQQAKAVSAAAATSAAVAAPAGFVMLRGASRAQASAALSRTEVTRHEYAQFVNATHRRASECSSSKLLGVFGGGRKNWTEPGFAQESNQPVVCVSWIDASAYVQWLNMHGGHYRLPSVADWHAASAASADATGSPGVDSSFSNWLQDCASGCQQHLVAGRSWRERKPAAASQHPGDHGFDDVGFRVVRELGGHN